MLCSENCIIKNCYGELYNNFDRMNKNNRNWACCIKDNLFEIGLGYVWDKQNKTRSLEFFPLIKQRLIDISVQSYQEQWNKIRLIRRLTIQLCAEYAGLLQNTCSFKFLRDFGYVSLNYKGIFIKLSRFYPKIWIISLNCTSYFVHREITPKIQPRICFL